MNKFLAATGGCTVVLAVLALLSMFNAFLWFLIDDRLAAYTGIPVLGQLDFTFVWVATILVSSLFGAKAVANSYNPKP